MSTNTDADPSDETQDADAAADSTGSVADEQTSAADADTADAPDGEASDEDPGFEAGQDDDSAAEANEPADASPDAQSTTPPAQFQAAIKGGPLKTALKTLSTLVDETRIHVDASGLQM